MSKSKDAFLTISEVARKLEVPAHVLRFWETKFPQVKPMKRGGNRRYYRPEDVQLLSGIRDMLHIDGYSIKGVQKVLKEQGVKAVMERADGHPLELPSNAGDKIVDVQGTIPDGPVETESAPLSQGERARLLEALRSLESLRAELLQNGRAAA